MGWQTSGSSPIVAQKNKHKWRGNNKNRQTRFLRKYGPQKTWQ